MKQSQRIYGLDILRATAILLVVFYHCSGFVSPYTGIDLFRTLPDGVTLFFVLSGFLIGGILLYSVNRTDFSFTQLKHFWYRRWLRTLPAYFFVLILLILHRIQTESAEELQMYLKFFLFIQNLNDGAIYFFPESWSLSVEEWFYVVFPLLIFISVRLFPSDKRKIILFWIILTILFSILIRFIRSGDIKNYLQWNEYIRKAVVTRIDSIMIGFLGAFLFYYKHRIWENKRFLFCLGMLLLLLPAVVFMLVGFSWFTIYFKIPLESAGTLLLLPTLASYKTGKGILFKFFSFTSLISYSMYLLNYTPFNEVVLPRLTTWLGLPDERLLLYDMIRLTVFIIWTFIAAWFLYLLVERPFMRLRNKLKQTG